MIENILIVDTETTGLKPKNCKVIEIAAILFNLKHKAILQCYSTLLPCEENPVENINHISAELTQLNYSTAKMDEILMGMSDYADACVAHNASFDKAFIATLTIGQHLLNKRWICTKANFTWPVHLQRFRLEDICNSLKVPYVQAHRALADCLLMSQCFQKVDDLLERFNKI